MDFILIPLMILVTNVAIGLAFAILKDVARNMLWGDTELVLQKLAIHHKPAQTETPHIEISGRRAGLIGYLLTMLNLSPTVSLTANAKEVRKTTSSLHGHSVEIIPLTQSVSIQADSQRSFFWLAAAFFCLTVGAAGGFWMGHGFLQKLMNATTWLAVAGIYLFAYYQSHRFQIIVNGTLRTGVSFKPSVIEGRAIRFPEVIEVVETLMERIQESRMLGVTASAAQPATPAEVPLLPMPAATHVPPAAPPSPFAPVEEPYIEDEDETLIQPAVSANAAKTAEVPRHPNTGTVEYGEDQPAFETAASHWNGSPEPGTSDSIQMRQSITRSETGMFLGVSGNLNDMDYDDEDMDSDDVHPNVGTHRGTVSWEDHADKTQDEIQAEAILSDLKRSRPKRGEAKLRLRELMRSFPQTDAALKARRMLERLESGH